MPRILFILLATLSALAQTIPLSEYAQRREALRKATPDGAILIYALRPPADNGDRNGIFQEPNFYYLSGLNEANTAMLLCEACPEGLKEVLFLPKRNARKEIYDGKMLAPEDPGIQARTGFKTVMPIAKLEATLTRALEDASAIHTLFDLMDSTRVDALKKLAPLRDINDIRMSIARLRVNKSPAEQAILGKAIDASIAAHLDSWTAAKSGSYEYEVSAVMQAAYISRGCERSAYPPIVGSGPNSTILHYNTNKRRMDSGDVLLVDVAGECSMYAADITRTVPVNGKWTERQKQIYNMVLGAQEAVIAAAKPGVNILDLGKVAKDYLNAQGNGPNGKPWGTYLPHGVSHHIGLDVHDPFDRNIPLAEGAVITVEPGLYIPEEGIGVRIEDMVLITAQGAKLLTGALPRDPAEIERRMKR